MIFVRDKGRMCNNILQYGHVYAWGREHGRLTVSMRFAYKYRYFHICDTKYHNFITYVTAKYLAKWKLIPTVGFHTPGAPTDTQERIMLSSRFAVAEGWHVRFYDLFLKYKKEIVALFDFRPEVRGKAEAIVSRCASDCDATLGVHIRRGDYKTWMGGRYLYSDDVYIDYIRQFAALHRGKKLCVFICGNDPGLDHDRFRRELPDMKIEFPEGNPGEDLCLLSMCGHIIGAPSTFSLVASMYRNSPLCWMETAQVVLTEAHFSTFDKLFRNIR